MYNQKRRRNASNAIFGVARLPPAQRVLAPPLLVIGSPKTFHKILGSREILGTNSRLRYMGIDMSVSDLIHSDPSQGEMHSVSSSTFEESYGNRQLS